MHKDPAFILLIHVGGLAIALLTALEVGELTREYKTLSKDKYYLRLMKIGAYIYSMLMLLSTA